MLLFVCSEAVDSKLAKLYSETSLKTVSVLSLHLLGISRPVFLFTWYLGR